MSSPLEGGLSGGDCPHLAPPCSPQLHIVHINVKYRTLAEAKGHPNGLAVLGFFFQVGLWGLTLPVGGGTPPTPPLPGTGCSRCGRGSIVRLPQGSEKGQEGWVKARRGWGT